MESRKNLVIEVVLFDEREQFREDAHPLPGTFHREGSEGVVVVVNAQADLLQVVGAIDAAGRFAHLLHRRQQQADQHGDDGDDHQQLDQRKAAAAPGTALHKDLRKKYDDSPNTRIK